MNLHDAFVEEVSKLSALEARMKAWKSDSLAMVRPGLLMTTNAALTQAKAALGSGDAVAMLQVYEAVKSVREGNEKMASEMEEMFGCGAGGAA